MGEIPELGAGSQFDLGNLLHRELDPETVIHIGGQAIPRELVGLLDRVRDAGSEGLVLDPGPTEANRDVGLLGFWGLVERGTNVEGRPIYRLPDGVNIDVLKGVEDAESRRIKEALANEGFALTSFEKTGMSGANFNFADHLLRAYYNAGILRVHKGDIPPDRSRARGVAYFRRMFDDAVVLDGNGRARRDGRLLIGDYAELKVAHRKNDNIEGKRPEYPLVRITDDDSLFVYTAFLANLSDEISSTVGHNMFTVRTDVVEERHQDNTNLLATAVLDVDGHGAVSQLWYNENGRPGRLAFEKRLEPGEFLVARDELFFHFGTRLIPMHLGHSPSRSALISTIGHGWKNDWPKNVPRLAKRRYELGA